MSDLISRQAAIDAVNVGTELLRRVLDNADIVGVERAKFEWGLGLIESCISDIKDLPSAQPEVRTEMSSPKNSERTTESSQYVQDDDLISRKAAIEAFWELDIETRPSWIDAVMRVLKEIPSAQPERKKGKWIKNDNGTYSCSVCQSWIPEEQHCYARYCLYCGAEMGGCIEMMKWEAERKGYTCNDCYLSMQNCHDMSIYCEDETGLCDYFEEITDMRGEEE